MTDTTREVFSIHIDATAEAVWHEITRTDRSQPAMFNTVLHTSGLTPGNPYQMRTPDGRHVSSLGEILECDPPRLLRQTMRFLTVDDPPATVTWEIEDAPQGGVDLTLTVDDLTAEDKARWRGSGGGSWVLKTLKRIVETDKVPLGTRAMYRVARVMQSRLVAKGSEVENWPLDG